MNVDGSEAIPRNIPAVVMTDEKEDLVRELFITFLEEYERHVLIWMLNISAPTVHDQIGRLGHEPFVSHGPVDGKERDYLVQISIMKENLGNGIYIDYSQLLSFNVTLATTIEQNYYQYEPQLRIGVQYMVRKYYEDYVLDQASGSSSPAKEFWVHFYNLPMILKLRDLRSFKIGQLSSFCATVTRTSEVRPELLFGNFHCMDCQTEIPNVEQRFRYTEPTRCKNRTCQNHSRWQLDVEGSKFVDWQKARVQENSNEIPLGAMPRHMDVILRQDAVEKAKAGDKCIFTGSLIVVPDVSVFRMPGNSVQSVPDAPDKDGEMNSTIAKQDEGISGLKSLGIRELTYRLAFLAASVQPVNAQIGIVNIRDDVMDDEDISAQFTDQEKEEIYQMRHDHNIYRKLARSIAPSIYGHDEVKKGILLMLFGGLHKQTEDGINLRGDINVCIIGDPSVAKSQFLKYVIHLVPRSVYTSGKASSAAGLTASVTKDVETHEYTIEAGALMLADSGICCIDEFDKMNPVDQVAIHEAMEQQTISISKAGIQATLNAKTSILAAANPIGGRYDKSRSLSANLAITPAILSRFDLMFVVLDTNDPTTDYNIARHIVSVHQKKDVALNPYYTQKQIQTYIKFAKTIKPRFTPAARQRVIEEYCKLRISDQGRMKSSWRITVRQLESMIRLSEAITRVHLEEEITPSFVEEAARLFRQSIINVVADHVEIEHDLRDAQVIEKQNNNQFDLNSNSSGGLEKKDQANIDQEVRLADKDPNGHIFSSSNANTILNSGQSLYSTTSKRQTIKTKITRDDYNRIQNLLLLYIHRHMQSSLDNQTMVQKKLIDVYLENNAYLFKGQEDVRYERAVVSAVINKMISSDKTLIVVKNSENKDERWLAISEELELDDFGV